jgi:hypothetical protein
MPDASSEEPPPTLEEARALARRRRFPVPASTSEEPLERSAQPEADAEPEHQEPSAMPRFWLGAERLKLGEVDTKLDANLPALAAEVRKHAPVRGTRGGLEERLWAALGRSVGLLERHLTVAEGTVSPFGNDVAAFRAAGETIRHLAETLDRLGMLKPLPPPVEAPEREWCSLCDGTGTSRDGTGEDDGEQCSRCDGTGEARSEYGAGVVICLVKFSEHLRDPMHERVMAAGRWKCMDSRAREKALAEAARHPHGDSARHYALIPRMIEIYDDEDRYLSSTIEVWANAASDHFGDLDYEKAPQSLCDLASLMLRMGHGFTGQRWTWDDYERVRDLWKQACLDVDRRLGVARPDWGEW